MYNTIINLSSVSTSEAMSVASISESVKIKIENLTPSVKVNIPVRIIALPGSTSLYNLESILDNWVCSSIEFELVNKIYSILISND